MKQRFAAANEYPVMISNRGSEKPCDGKKTKRVRFDPDYASVRECKSPHFPGSDAPKTSEYAYFMNTKNDAVHGHSRSYTRDNGQLKISKTSTRGREDVKPSNRPIPSSKDLRFSDCRETAGHFGHHLLLTPPVGKYKEPSRGDIKDLTKNITQRPLLLSENVTPVGRNSSLSTSTLREASENTYLSGNQCKEKDIFSAKRLRLRQWAHDSISEVEKPHPEGVGLISSLLSRLYHKCDESNLFYLHDSSKEKIDNSCKAHVCCKFKNLEERLHVSYRREWDTEPPKICFGGHRDGVFLERDAYFSGSPFTNNGTEAHFKDKSTDLHVSSKDKKIRSSQVECDLAFCLPFEYGYSSYDYFKELDGSRSPFECQSKEPHRFSLKWDFERGRDGSSTSIIDYKPTRIYSPGLSTTWNVNYQQIVDYVPDGKAVSSPSLFSNYYLQCKSIRGYPSTCYFTSDFVPNFDQAKCSVQQTDMSSLTFPTTPKCIPLIEDTNAENIPYSSNMIFSFSDQTWLKNKAWDSKLHTDFWWKGFQDADLSIKNHSIFHTWQFPQVEDKLCSFSFTKEAPGEIFSLCSEDTIHHHPRFLNFSPSLDNTTNRPLQLENASNGWSNREAYFDDDSKIDDRLCSFSIPEEAPGEIFALCSEDTVHNQPWLLKFSSSLDSTTNRPLLLDNASDDWSNRQVYFDKDNKWNYEVDVIP